MGPARAKGGRHTAPEQGASHPGDDVCAYMYIHMCVYLYLYLSISIYLSFHLYIYIYIYIYIGLTRGGMFGGVQWLGFGLGLTNPNPGLTSMLTLNPFRSRGP